ncbi:MAG TPA: hypothetical protein VN635_04460 [Conexibacter sp.]|nr:hypothetical protein [Conexibacter sp.]
MRRPAVIAFLALALAALATVVALGAGQRRSLAFTLGVTPFAPVATLQPGQQVCQQPIPAAAPFEAVELRVRAQRQPTGPLVVTVVRVADRAPLGRGTLADAAPRAQRRVVAVGHVDVGGEIALCVRDAGRRAVALYGGPDQSARTSSAYLDGRPLDADLDIVFRRADPVSTLTLLPRMLDSAALFRVGWIGPWLYWLLLAAVAIGVPLLLARSLGRATSGEGEPPRAD